MLTSSDKSLCTTTMRCRRATFRMPRSYHSIVRVQRMLICKQWLQNVMNGISNLKFVYIMTMLIADHDAILPVARMPSARWADTFMRLLMILR